jgi:hypothetical protein
MGRIKRADGEEVGRMELPDRDPTGMMNVKISSDAKPLNQAEVQVAADPYKAGMVGDVTSGLSAVAKDGEGYDIKIPKADTDELESAQKETVHTQQHEKAMKTIEKDVEKDVGRSYDSKIEELVQRAKEIKKANDELKNVFADTDVLKHTDPVETKEDASKTPEEIARTWPKGKPELKSQASVPQAPVAEGKMEYAPDEDPREEEKKIYDKDAAESEKRREKEPDQERPLFGKISSLVKIAKEETDECLEDLMGEIKELEKRIKSLEKAVGIEPEKKEEEMESLDTQLVGLEEMKASLLQGYKNMKLAFLKLSQTYKNISEGEYVDTIRPFSKMKYPIEKDPREVEQSGFEGAAKETDKTIDKEHKDVDRPSKTKLWSDTRSVKTADKRGSKPIAEMSSEEAKSRWEALGGSHSSCAKEMSGKGLDEHAYCAALEHKATGKWPAEAKEIGLKRIVIAAKVPPTLPDVKDIKPADKSSVVDNQITELQRDLKVLDAKEKEVIDVINAVYDKINELQKAKKEMSPVRLSKSLREIMTKLAISVDEAAEIALEKKRLEPSKPKAEIAKEVGTEAGLEPSQQEELTKKLLQSKLKAVFVKLPDKKASYWTIFAGETPILKATVEDAFGEQLDKPCILEDGTPDPKFKTNEEFVSSKEYGEEVIRSIREKGLKATAREMNGKIITASITKTAIAEPKIDKGTLRSFYNKIYPKEFVDKLIKEYRSKVAESDFWKKKAQDLELDRQLRIKAGRAIKLADALVNKGLIDRNNVDKEIDNMMDMDDKGFEAIEKLVKDVKPAVAAQKVETPIKTASVKKLGINKGIQIPQTNLDYVGTLENMWKKPPAIKIN